MKKLQKNFSYFSYFSLMQSKRLFLLFIGFPCFFSIMVKAQPSKLSEQKKWIKEHLGDYQKTIAFKDNKAEKLVYHQDSVAQLISIEVKEDGVKKFVEWYFKDGQIFYSEQLWTEEKTGNRVDYQKAYYSDGNLSLWIKNGINIDKYSPEFNDFNSQMAGFVKNLKGQFK